MVCATTATRQSLSATTSTSSGTLHEAVMSLCWLVRTSDINSLVSFFLMNKVRITAIRQTIYEDLMAKYENPIEHTCNVSTGQQWISVDGQQPEGLCPSAWESMRSFVESLARGEGNFFDGWMKNPMSAMISCNDGFRPFSFYLEVIDE